MSEAKQNWQEFITQGNAPLGRSSSSLAILNNKAYIFSGENIPRIPIDNNLYILDLATKQWSTIVADSSFPVARIGHYAAAAYGKLYLFGGRTAYDNLQTLADFWVFSPETSQWTQLAPSGAQPEGLSYHTMASDGENIYIFGGCKAEGRSNELWQYNIAENSWKQLESKNGTAPSARGGPSFTAINNQLHVLFGYNGENELADHFIYDLASSSWREIQNNSGPPARSVTDVVALRKLGSKGSLLVFGGEYTPSAQGHEGAGEYHNDSWLYDIAQDQWAQLSNQGEKPAARGWFNITALEDGQSALLFGGFDGNIRRNDVYLFVAQ
jgi:N-acetylneuraminic acid mutarotase